MKSQITELKKTWKKSSEEAGKKHVSLVKELDFKRNIESLKGLLWSEYLYPPKTHMLKT